jgi:hypothetical protein
MGANPPGIRARRRSLQDYGGDRRKLAGFARELGRVLKNRHDISAFVTDVSNGPFPDSCSAATDGFNILEDLIDIAGCTAALVETIGSGTAVSGAMAIGIDRLSDS